MNYRRIDIEKLKKQAGDTYSFDSGKNEPTLFAQIAQVILDCLEPSAPEYQDGCAPAENIGKGHTYLPGCKYYQPGVALGQQQQSQDCKDCKSGFHGGARLIQSCERHSQPTSSASEAHNHPDQATHPDCPKCCQPPKPQISGNLNGRKIEEKNDPRLVTFEQPFAKPQECRCGSDRKNVHLSWCPLFHQRSPSAESVVFTEGKIPDPIVSYDAKTKMLIIDLSYFAALGGEDTTV